MAKIKKQRKKGDNGIVIATVIITLLFVISAGYLIGGDNLVSTVFQKESKGRTFYFITTDNFDDITIARQNAELIRCRGGAGYVDMRESNRIILAVYPDEQSAKSVFNKMGDGSLVVAELETPEYKINLKKKDLNTACTDALTYFDIAFDGLYKLSNDLADNLVSVEDVKVQISALYSRIDEIKSAFYEKTKESDVEIITEIKVAIVTCLAIIDGVEIGDYAGTLSSLRRQAVQLVYCYQSLLNTL